MTQNDKAGWITEIETLIKARCPLIAIQSFEEERVLSAIRGLCEQLQLGLRLWSRTRGFYFADGRDDNSLRDPMAALKAINDEKSALTYVMLDFHPFLKDAGIVRMLRDLNQNLKTSRKTVLLLSPLPIETPELARDLMRVDIPLPDGDTIQSIIREVLDPLPDVKSEVDLETVGGAAAGLTQNEIENILAQCLVSSGSVEARRVLQEKKALVKSSGTLDFIDLGNGLASVGGLQRLKDWLQRRQHGLSHKARDLNLPAPKGILMVGIPGCGKSLTARATASSWNLPLIRLDVGRVFAGIVGASEENMRRAIQTAEAMAPCILWIDEIEKAFAGMRGSGSGDSGTSLRVFGTFLTWMQENEKPVFVVATANNISQLPPEFLRKGRFDELFFIDLPQPSERLDILKIHSHRYNWDLPTLDSARFIEASEGFSGAEIEQALISARYEAFFHDRELTFDDLITALRNTVPLATTMPNEIEALRAWAKSRAVHASPPPEEKPKAPAARALELGT